MSRLVAAWFVCLLLAAPVCAEVQLVLVDGRILDGIDVTRKQDQYLLEVAANEIMSIPVELVKEMRLSSDKPRPKTGIEKAEAEILAGQGPATDAPNGIRLSESRVLAGSPEPVQPTKPAEALEVFGEAAGFQPGSADPYWQPDSVFNEDNDVTDFNPSTWARSLIDPVWEPTPAYTREGDVTNFARSDWPSTVVDSEWHPEDGFKKRSMSFSSQRPLWISGDEERWGRSGLPVVPAKLVDHGGVATPDECDWCPVLTASPRQVSVSVEESPAHSPDPRREATACATELFRPEIDFAGAGVIWGVRSTPVEDESLARLPIDIYDGHLTLGDVTRVARFTTAGGGCRLLQGDLEALLGLDDEGGSFAVHTLRVYNEAVAETEPPSFTSADEKLEYVMTVRSLFIPEDSPQRVVISQDQFEALLRADVKDCRVGSRRRRHQKTKARGAFAEPRVVEGAAVDVVRFLTWTPDGGRVDQHTVYLAEDGTLTLHVDQVADCIGEHSDRRR